MDRQKDHKVTIIQKVITSASEAQSPSPGHTVKLKTWNDQQGPERSVTGLYLIGNNQLNEEIEQVVLQMKPGDQWKIQLQNRLTDKLETLHVQLVSSEKSQEGQEFIHNPKTTFTRADECKKQGNSFIKQKKYKQAISSYKKSYELVEFGCDQQSVQIRLSVVSNLALATLNAGKFRQCLDWCSKYTSQAVELNKKILYREVSAYKGLKQWNKAKQKATKALQLFSQDAQAQTDFKALRDTIQKQQKIQVAKQKKVYTNMFG